MYEADEWLVFLDERAKAEAVHTIPVRTRRLRSKLRRSSSSVASLLRWTAEDLAHSSALSVATIRRAELTEEATKMTTANDIAVRRALEAAGVEFIDANGGGPGVRLRDNKPRT
jgi:hypothetical protein